MTSTLVLLAFAVGVLVGRMTLRLPPPPPLTSERLQEGNAIL